MGKRYGQYCPIARAAEVICERWTPLVLRELMSGSCHFNEISHGVPLMSRALLIKRLKELETAGIITRHDKESGQGSVYRLTPGGEALRPVIDAMGVWAQQWTSDQLSTEYLDDELLMWGLRRGFNLDVMPTHKIVLQFDLRGIPKRRRTERSYWVVIEQRRVDVCMQDPGFDIDVLIAADLSAITHVMMGYDSLERALTAKTISFDGKRDWVSQLPTWLYLSGERRYLSGLAPATSGEMS